MAIAVVCTLLLGGGVGYGFWKVRTAREDAAAHTPALDEQRAREHARPLTAVHVIHPPRSLPGDTPREPVQFDPRPPADPRK